MCVCVLCLCGSVCVVHIPYSYNHRFHQMLNYVIFTIHSHRSLEFLSKHISLVSLRVNIAVTAFSCCYSMLI